MHIKTEALLRTCARARWRNSCGPVADAINEWQEAGRPDLPKMEEPTDIVRGLASDLEALSCEEETLSRKEITQKLDDLVASARWKLRELEKADD